MFKSLSILSLVFAMLAVPSFSLLAQDGIPPELLELLEEVGFAEEMIDISPLGTYVSGMTETKGLFTYYTDETTKRALICLKPEQFDSPFFVSQTLSRGTGDWMFTAPMMWDTSIIEFRRDRHYVEFVIPNIQYSTVQGEPMARAFDAGFSDYIVGRAFIEAESPDDGRLVFDLGMLLVATNPVSYYGSWLGQSIDWEGSYVTGIKGFPLNDEIDTRILVTNWGSSASQEINLHFSLSAPPEEGYVPRVADDRVGYFIDQRMVYSVETDRREDRYERFIQRWRLEKANPDAEMSEPVKPIVFWIENTVPYEYRDAVREGILAWNDAFERIGFKNAIQVKQMPDDADWDPADIRYNTVRWFVSPYSSYAIGPCRTDPRTGEIFDADVGVSADMLAYAFQNWRFEADPLNKILSLISPPGWPDLGFRQVRWDDKTNEILEERMLGAAIHAFEGARVSTVLYARGMEPGSDDEKEFIRQYLVSLVMHEIGHVLGLRHNFAGSSATPFHRLHVGYWTRQNGLSQSIMDYHGSNIAPFGMPQGAVSYTHLTLPTKRIV